MVTKEVRRGRIDLEDKDRHIYTTMYKTDN